MNISESSQLDGALAGTGRLTRRPFLRGAVAATAIYLAAAVSPASAQHIGPSTRVEPYLVPSHPDVKTVSILTVGDLNAANGYRMVGIPDGLGAFRTGQEFTVLMNHELGATQGITRAHGSRGAFVSRWTVDRSTLEVLQGEDHTPSPDDVFVWDPIAQRYTQGTTAWNRLCSADLAARGAYRYRDLGTRDRIYLNGEEVDEGRAWARIATGQNRGEAWELPRFGKISWENVVASPYPQPKTVVMLLDDGDLDTVPGANDFPSEVYVYVGKKHSKGHPVEKGGLTNGKFYGMKVFLNDGTLVAQESDAFGLGNAGTGYIGAGRFELVELGRHGDVSGLSARQLQDAANEADILHMRRVEDGAWDPRRRHKDDFYFVTTADVSSNSRLWRLRFGDVERPEDGGTIEILVRGDEGHKMFDNMTVDGCGRVLLQEDPGGDPRLSKVWVYGIQSGNLVEVAHHNPKFFDPTAPRPATFLTANEESSGIIDAASILGRGWFLVAVQAHFNIGDPELVEGGQLLALFVDRDIECAHDHEDDGGGHNGDDD